MLKYLFAAQGSFDKMLRLSDVHAEPNATADGLYLHLNCCDIGVHACVKNASTICVSLSLRQHLRSVLEAIDNFVIFFG